ncbi:MAG: choice-of-anchor Q domain-containing protein [Solirubrobacterales bacterium]
MALAVALLAPSAASAGVINVTTSADEFNNPGPNSRCSLREAVWAANNDSNAQAPGCSAGNGVDTITVPAGRYRLGRFGADENADLTGDLDITGPVTIVHKGIAPATVDSDATDRVFEVTSSGVATLDGLSITDGRATSVTSTSGGGVLNGGTLTLRNSVVYENVATFGGGISTAGTSTTTVTNTTIASNQAYEDGGGVDAETGGNVTLNSTTVAGNTADVDFNGGGSGGGVTAATSGLGGAVKLRNALVARNIDNGGEAPDCVEFGGSITSQGHSLIGDTTGCSYTAGSGDIANRNPQLLALMDNGGPTLTRATRKTSPILNKGAGCPSTDQRGVVRKLGGRCDIGAWELVRCQGVVVNRIGTGVADRLRGTETADGFLGLGGGDLLQGFGGNDGLCGGSGGDRLEGGDGNDTMDGGSGRDTCIGGSGRNVSKSCELPKKKRAVR